MSILTVEGKTVEEILQSHKCFGRFGFAAGYFIFPQDLRVGLALARDITSIACRGCPKYEQCYRSVVMLHRNQPKKVHEAVRGNISLGYDTHMQEATHV